MYEVVKRKCIMMVDAIEKKCNYSEYFCYTFLKKSNSIHISNTIFGKHLSNYFKYFLKVLYPSLTYDKLALKKYLLLFQNSKQIWMEKIGFSAYKITFFHVKQLYMRFSDFGEHVILISCIKYFFTRVVTTIIFIRNVLTLRRVYYYGATKAFVYTYIGMLYRLLWLHGNAISFQNY